MPKGASSNSRAFSHEVFMSHCQDEDLVGHGQINEGKVSTRLALEGWPVLGMAHTPVKPPLAAARVPLSMSSLTS